jgi:hypothetical protein
MTRNETRVLPLIAAALVVLSGCGNKKDLGAEIEMGVTGQGVIVPGSVQSCTDKAAYTTARSVQKNAMIFSNFTLKYTGLNKQLFVTSLRILVSGPGITGGEAEFTIASLELEALLGRRGATIVVPAGETEVIIQSNVQSTRSTTFPACSLAVGPISISDPDGTFNASVDIKLTGTASNTLTGEVERVEEKITGTAFF